MMMTTVMNMSNWTPTMHYLHCYMWQNIQATQNMTEEIVYTKRWCLIYSWEESGISMELSRITVKNFSTGIAHS